MLNLLEGDEAVVGVTGYFGEVSAGFGPLKGKVWRVGLMGYNARAETVDVLLGALEDALRTAR